MQTTSLSGVSHPLPVEDPLPIPEYHQHHANREGSQALERAMLHTGVIVSFSRGEDIFGDDDPADKVYKVLTGTVCTYKILSDGRRQIGEFYLPNDSFGLENVSRRSHSAAAITDGKILVTKRAALMALAGHDPAVARQLLILTAFELARAQDRVLLLAKTAEERVAGFLIDMTKRLPARNLIELPMLRQDIADYLGLTIETVSRTLKLLKDHSAIDVSTRKVMVRNHSTLSRING
jgi:CRP/FNR family transcriptional regulator, nitrogen fixation regulation protein